MADHEGAFRRARLALHEGERHVAAEDAAALLGEALGEAARHRRDPGDGHDAERDAGEKNTEAANAAAQLAQGEPQGQGQPPSPRGRVGENAKHSSRGGVKFR